MIYSYIRENENIESQLTESEQQMLRNYYIYALEYFNDDSEEFEITTEGTNIDILKTLNAGLKSYKDDLREVKRAIRKGDTETAKAKIKSARATIEETKKNIRKIPDDVSSAVMGTIINFVITFAYIIFPTFGIKIGKKHNFWLGLAVSAVEVPATIFYSGFSIPVKGMARVLRLVMEIEEESKKGVVDARLYNQFRLHCISCLTECDEILKNLEKKIKE